MPDPADTVSQLPAQLTALAPVLHAVVAVWGLIECFLGFRIFKATVRILMGFAGAGAGAMAALTYYPDSLQALGIGAVAGLVIGMLLGWFMYRLGVFTLGFFLGTLLAAPFSGQLGPELTWLIPAAVGIICGILAVVLLNLMVMAATALTGGFRVVYGTAFFFGGPSLLILIEDPSKYGTLATERPLLAGLTLLVGAIGFYYQFTTSRPKKVSDE